MRWCRLPNSITALLVAANIACPETTSSSDTVSAAAASVNSDLAPAASVLQFPPIEVVFAEIHSSPENSNVRGEPSPLIQLSEDRPSLDHPPSFVDDVETPRTLANDETFSVSTLGSSTCQCNDECRHALGHAQLRIIQWIIVALGLLMSIVLCSAGRSLWDRPADDREPEPNRPSAALRAVNRPARALSVASSRALPPYDPPPAYVTTADEPVTRALAYPRTAMPLGLVPAVPDGYAIHVYDSRLFNAPAGVSSASQATAEGSADPSNVGPFR